MPLVALVVDSSALIRNEVQRFLRTRGYAVTTLANGADALSRLDFLQPQLIVTSLTLPQLSGNEFIREVRHRANLSETTIIGLTGRRGRNQPKAEAVADFVIYKEVDLIEQLRLALDDLVPLPPVKRSGRKAPSVR